MDVRSPLTHYTALIVAGVLFLNPIVGTAAQLAVDGAGKGTSIGAAGNGVPVVNIAKPNGSGLSTNTFSHYNVDKKGIILNNATGKLQNTQLGGIIVGNPHLKNGAAKVILNQVTGGDRSYLGGYTEVAGKSARVIVANPHGVTCNGCGFINTPRVTLTTGTPIMDGERIERFHVEGGDIAIEGEGLDASRVEQFDLITRSTRLNAELHAKKLNIVAGRNDVQADSLQATALADDGSEKPQLAIDSSALGGMYAGAIRLVGTEKGVGVKLAGDMASSAGDIQIDSNGTLSVAGASSSGNLQLAAQDVELTGKAYAGGRADIRAAASVVNRQSLAARDGIEVSAAQITNRGVIEAGIEPNNTRNNRADLTLRGQDVRNSGRVVASRDLAVEVSGTVDNRAGKLIGLNDARVAAGALDNSQQGVLTAAGNTRVVAAQVDNRQGEISAANTEVSATRLDNRGGKVLGDEVKLDARTLDNSQGTVQATGHLEVVGGDLLNRNGALLGETATLRGSTLDNGAGGRVIANSGTLAVTVTQALGNQGGRLQASTGDVQIEAGSVDNSAGTIVGKQVSVSAREGELNNRGGQLLGTGLMLAGQTLDNRDGGQMLAGSAGLQLVAGQLLNQRGTLSASYLRITADAADNSAGQLLSLTGNLDLTVERLSNQGGLIETAGQLALDGQTLNNSGGGRIIAHDGALSRVQLSGELNNRGGRIASGSEALTLGAGSLLNEGGTVEHGAKGLFTLHAGHVSGSGGRITGLGHGQWTLGNATGTGIWHLNGALDISGFDSIALNAGDQIASAAALSLRGTHVSSAGQLLSNANLNLDLAGNLDNGGRLTSANDLTISAQNITNRGTLGAQNALMLTARQGISNLQDSLIFSGADMQLRADSLYNYYGDLYSQGAMTFAALDGGQASSLRNLSGSIESEHDIGIKVRELENAKAVFTTGETMVGRQILINCTDCRGNHHTGLYIVRTTYQGTVLEDSPAARLLANRDLLLEAVTVVNGQSLLAANRDMNVKAVNLYNRGFTLDTREEDVSHLVHDVRQKVYRVVEAATNAWNANNAGLAPQDQQPLPTVVTQYPVYAVTSLINQGTHNGSSGTVQAGGTLNLSLSGELVNGTLTPHSVAQLTGNTLDSATLINEGVRVTVGTQVGDVGVLPDVKRVETRDADGNTVVSFVPVDFSAAPFVAVDPTALPDFRLPQGEYGLFVHNPKPGSSYLIETNPALTQTGRFLSSDYLLDLLGYDPDVSKRRLGDGGYETRLIADAVRAQTGQRFLAAGLNSDYEQFKYLMDNAVASQEALSLSVGVALTGAQVSALTHDMVWMETRVVDGQAVLAPVLYLAKVDARNVRGGSLIQGRDLNLLTGGDMYNVGTLRASEDLGMVVGGALYQGGLAQANDNLTVLAQKSIRNALAGEIRADRVNLTSLTGDILNDRTATEVNIGAGSVTRVDAGSVISARSQLNMDAANDLTNKGRISSGGDATLAAGRDLNMLAVQERTVTRDTGEHRGLRVEERITQLGSSTSAEGNLRLVAGRDVNAIASQASAGQSLNVEAGRDINLLAAADEHSVDERYKKGKKKIHEVEEHTRQVASVFSAGGNIGMVAAQNINLHASKVAARQEAYLFAGQGINLTAAQDRDHSLYDMKKKGSWGAKQAQRDEVTDVRAVGSQISSGTDLSLVSGGDQLYQGASLQSGKDLSLLSGGSITFEAVTDLHDESHTKSKSDLGWFSMKGKGQTDEALRQSELVAQGELVIQAANSIHIDVKKVDQQTVSQSIDAMVAADPKLAWLKQVERQGGIDWRQVEELHTRFKYQNAGLGAGAQLAIAIMMAAVMGPAGFGLTGFQLGAAASLATTGTVSTINNKGNLGAALKDTLGKDSLKGAAVSSLTAGSLQYVDAEWFQAAENSQAGAVSVADGAVVPVSSTPNNVLSWSTASDTLTRSGTHALVSSGISTAVNGGSFGDNLGSALMTQAGTVALATGFNFVGDHTLAFDDGSVPKIFAHALMGGLVAEATGSDFKTGAMAAGLNEALINEMSALVEGNTDLHLMLSQLTGVVAAAAVDGDLNKGAEIAYGSTYYNRELHAEEKEAIRRAGKEEDLDPVRLEKAACYIAKCWAQIDRGTPEYKEKMLTEQDMVGYSNELAWIEAQQEQGLFKYSFWDKTKDFATRDAEPLASDGGKIVTGAIGVTSGATLCTASGGLGCVPGGVMFSFGASNVVEGGHGVYNHFFDPGEAAFNPVKGGFEYLFPGNGLLLYSGIDMVTAGAAGVVRVPLKMGTADGLNRATSMFGVKVNNALNEKFVLGRKLPAGSAAALYMYGVSDKVIEFKNTGEANGK